MNLAIRVLMVLLTPIHGFTPRSTEMEDLLDLLQKNIEETRIKVRCSALSSSLEVDKCLEMSRNPELCKFSWLCGEGCRVACIQVVPGDILIQDIEQTSCSVSWFLDGSSPAQYIVVAQDGAGMWRILKDGHTSGELDLSAQDTEKYKKISVLAISGFGVEDVRSLRIHPSDCSPIQAIPQSSPAAGNHGPEHVQLILLVSAVLTMVFCLISVLLYCAYSRRTRSRVITEKLSPIIKDESKCKFLREYPDL